MKKFELTYYNTWLSNKNTNQHGIVSLINDYISKSETEKFCLVVPTNRKARAVKKEIIDSVEDSFVSKMNVETLTTLSNKLLAEILNYEKLSDTAASVYLEKISSGLKLQYFNKYGSKFPTGTLERIRNVISEYKRHGISPETLRNEAESLTGSEKYKALDIALMYEEFNKKCEEVNFCEIGDVYHKLIESSAGEFENSVSSVLNHVEAIFFIGFNELSRLEINILNKLQKIGRMGVYVNYEFDPVNEYLFRHIRKMHEGLLDIGLNQVSTIENQSSDFKEFLRRNLFNYKLRNNKVNNDNITVSVYKNRDDEIKEIAGQIKKIIVEEKADPSKICLAFNLVNHYSSKVKDTFNNFGIPANITDRSRLDNSNPVTLILSVLEILENNYFSKNIIRALGSKLINMGDVSAHDIIRTSAELKIIGGKNNWLDSVNHALKKNISPGFHDSFIKTKKLVEDFSVLLAEFEKDFKPLDFYHQLLKLIDQLDIHKNMVSQSTSLNEENIKSLSTFIELLKEIFTLIVREEGNKKNSLGFYLDRLRTAASQGRYNIKERQDKGVLITAIDEIRGFEFEYLFIAGLTDGELPTRYDPEIFFTSKFKRGEEIHLSEEKHKFYNVLTSWKNKLFLSFSLSDGKKELVKSSFLEELYRLVNIEEKLDNTNENFIFSMDQLQSEGSELNSYPDFSESISQNYKFAFENAEKAIISENSRKLNSTESEYSGNLSLEISEEIKDKLEQFADREYSVSQLELYAKCPFKYFITRVLGIDEISEPEDEPEALEIGIILHEILYKFYKFVAENKLKVAGCSDEIFNQLEDYILKIGRDIYAEADFNPGFSFYIEEKIFGLEGKWHDSILYKFLEFERNSESDFEPAFFEIPFGKLSRYSKTENTLPPLDIDGIKVQGKIDRIDINKRNNGFSIIDYKTGPNRVRAVNVANGIDLQIPVYMMAAQRIIEEEFGSNYDPLASFIYSLKYTEKDFGLNEVKIYGRSKKGDNVIELNKNILKKTKEHIRDYVDGIISGKFNLSELPNREEVICKYCSLKFLCRKDS